MVHAITDKQNSLYGDRKINPYRIAAIERFSGRSFLDVGCGNGNYVLRFEEQYNSSGVDWQSFPCWSEAPHRFKTGLASELPYSDDSFDRLTCFEVLEHVPEPAKVMTELARVARQNVIVTVPNGAISDGLKRSGMTFNHYCDRTHVNFFQMETIKALGISAGMRLKAAHYINQVCPAAWVLETFRIPMRFLNLARKLFRLPGMRPTYMTCLVVFEKIN